MQFLDQRFKMAVDARKFPRAIERVCETFKISSLYPEQETSLKALLEGKKVYASLPTGYGKSLIFRFFPGRGGCDTG